MTRHSFIPASERLRKLLWVMSAFLLAIGPLAGSAAWAQDGYSPDISRILTNKKLIVSMLNDDVGGAPFFALDKEGNLFGIDVELAKDIARNFGVEVEFLREARTYDEVIDIVAAGRADIGLSCLSPTRVRAMKASFTVPYVRFYHGILINRMQTKGIPRDASPRKWLDSEKMALGTLEGSSYMEFAKLDYPKVKLVEYPDFDTAAIDVVSGKITAAIFDDFTVTQWVDKHPADVLYVQARIMKEREDPICMAVSWQDAHLLQWLNLYLSSIESDGYLARLRTEYVEGNAWRERMK